MRIAVFFERLIKQLEGLQGYSLGGFFALMHLMTPLFYLAAPL